MLNKPLNRIVFLDIETTSQFESYSKMPIRKQDLFYKRFKKDIEEFKMPALKKDDAPIDPIESIYDTKAPLFAEFNKIVCISMGVINMSNPEQYKLSIKSFINFDDEKALLLDFINAKSIKDFKSSRPEDRFNFCAHNGKIFDFPVIAKRLIYNGIDLPYVFDYTDFKPWDLDFLIDTKDVWKYNVFDGNVSLDLLADSFGIESSKAFVDGSMVKNLYYELKDDATVKKYCELDVYVLACVYLKMKNIQIPLAR